MPPWILPSCAIGSFALALVIAMLQLSERFYATKDSVAKLESETAKSHLQLQQAMTDKMSLVKSEAADKLSKAIDERRRDVSAMESTLRADHKANMEAIENRLLLAIREFKEDRKVGEATLFAKLDHLTTMVLSPKVGE